jgi:hypothetical protein
LILALDLNINGRYTTKKIWIKLYEIVFQKIHEPIFKKFFSDVDLSILENTNNFIPYLKLKNHIEKYIIKKTYNKYIILNDNQHKSINEIMITI